MHTPMLAALAAAVLSLHATIRAQEQPPAAAAQPTAAEASVDAALRWLVEHQDKDGKWDCDGFMKHDQPDGEACDGAGNAVRDVGVTGLAVLALLGNGSTLRDGPHRDALKKAVAWLRDQQQENGLFGVNASHDFIYDHAIATYAMCEAFGRSNYKLIKHNAQKGIDYLEAHRNPYAVWRYQPRDGDCDTSVTTWAVSACASGKSFGLHVNQQALDAAAAWYDQVTTDDGRAGYSKKGERSSRHAGDHKLRFPVENGEAMTAAAMFGRLMLGQTPGEQPVLAKAASVLASRPPQWQPGHVDAIYWFFGTYAMKQMGGEPWEAWSRSFAAVIEQQRQEGNAAGSWDPVGVWDADGGRVYVTALYALSLQAAPRDKK